MTRTVVFMATLGLFSALPQAAAAQERLLRGELTLDAPIETVWQLWSTEEGVRSFFARGARIEPRVDGAYEILFSPDSPPGQRGAEGLRIVVFEPPRRIAFTWNAPPKLPSVREQRTIVEIQLTATSQETTQMVFLQYGWGRGQEWDAAYEYFNDSWNRIVFSNLKHRIAHGPIDWRRPPATAPVVPSLKHEVSMRAVKE